MDFYTSRNNNRRVDRRNAGLPVELVLYDDREENILAGSSTAYISDISIFGAGLVVPKIEINKHHLFYGPNEKSYILYLKKGCPECSRTLSIQVRPKWYRLGDNNKGRFFCLGIEFINAKNVDDISQLRNMAKEYDVPKKNWLTSIFSR